MASECNPSDRVQSTHHVPLVLTRIQPYYLSLTGNPITELPTEIFEIEGLLYLGLSEMNINEFPRNVTQLCSTLSWIYIGETNVSFFSAWVDELVERMKDEAPPWLAGASACCNELEKIENGDIDAFSVPLSHEYSQTLMNSSEANRRVILNAVNCDATEAGLFTLLVSKMASMTLVTHLLWYARSDAV